MGDSGSTVLGFVVAFLALDFFGANSSKAPAIFFPVLITALPLLDAALAMLRRLQSQSSPTAQATVDISTIALGSRLVVKKSAALLRGNHG